MKNSGKLIWSTSNSYKIHVPVQLNIIYEHWMEYILEAVILHYCTQREITFSRMSTMILRGLGGFWLYLSHEKYKICIMI